MKINNDDVFAFAILGGAVAAIVHDIYQTNRVNTALRKLGTSVNDILDRTDVEINDSLIRHAVEKAAKEEASKMVKAAGDEVKVTIVAEMTNQIKNAISALYFNMQSETEAEMKRQIKTIGPIELDKLKRIIIEEAKAEAKRKADGEIQDAIDAAKDTLDDAVLDLKVSYEKKLDDLFENFGDQLKTMKRVTDSLNKTILT